MEKEETTRKNQKDEMQKEETKPNAKLQKALDNLAVTSLKYSSVMNNAIHKDMQQPFLTYTLYNKNQTRDIIKVNKFKNTSDGGIVWSKKGNLLSEMNKEYLFVEDSNLSFCLFQNDLKKWDNIKNKYINLYITEKLEFFDFSFENRNESEGGNVNEN